MTTPARQKDYSEIQHLPPVMPDVSERGRHFIDFGRVVIHQLTKLAPPEPSGST
jgi:hypothetical protein